MGATNVVEFSMGETIVYLDSDSLSDDEGPPFIIHGVALGEGDTTTGQSGTKKFWPAEELRQAAETLERMPLVENHDNSTRGVVGEVVKAGYKDGVGVIYEAELDDEELAEKISNGRLDVSVRGLHKSTEELDENEDGAKIVEDIVFDNLSIVPNGAAPSNTVQMGEHSELSAAALAEFTEDLSSAELETDSVEPADYVKWDGGQGIVFQVDGDEAIVEVMEKVDGKFRAIDEQETVPIDDLSMWDVDEDEDIGAPKDDEESMDMDGSLDEADFEEGMLVRWQVNPDMFGEVVHIDREKDVIMVEVHEYAEDGSVVSTGRTVTAGFSDLLPTSRSELAPVREFMFDSEQEARDFVEGKDGFTDVHSHEIDGETKWMPGADMSEFEDWHESQHSAEENMSLVRPGMKFFSTVNDVQVSVVSVDGNMVTVRAMDDGSEWTETMDDIIQKLADGDWDHVGHIDNAEMEEDTEPLYSQGDWVEWDTRNSTEKGTVVGSYMEGDDLPDFRGSRGLSPEGDEILYALRMYKQRDGSWHPIEGKPIGHYEESLRSTDKPSNVSESSVELGRSNHEQYDVEEEQWVQWYPSETTEKHGFATNVDDDGNVTIEVWTQNSDGTWKASGETVTKEMEEVEPWGNFPRKQEEFADDLDPNDPRKQKAKGPQRKEGSEENPEGSAASAESLESIDFSDQVTKALKNKVEEHNEKYGDEKGKKVTLRKLKAVYRRGAGAYSDSHREGMTRNQWAMARVNAFLYLVRNGQPENDLYVQDNDLLPEGHPKYDEDPDDEEENSFEEPGSVEVALLSDYDQRFFDDEELASMDELDEVYDEWQDAVNMTASELRQWSKNPCSREASVEPVKVIRRNLRLLETDKSDWDRDDIADAKRTVSFVSRMSSEENEPDSPKDGPHGCPSEWAISLLNWAHNPFDSLPEHPEDSDLDSVDEVTLSGPEMAEDDISGEDKCNQPHRYPEHSCDKCTDEEELQEYEMHTPEWDGTTESEWNSPDYSEFQSVYGFDENFADLSDEQKSQVAQHFLIARGGFPGETYADLKLPVVEPNGDLSRNALLAVKGGRGASAVEGLSSEMESDIIEWVNMTANEEFDEDWGDEEEMAEVQDMDRYERTREMIAGSAEYDGNSMEDTIVKFEGHANMSIVTDVVEEYASDDGNDRFDPVDELDSWLESAAAASKHMDEEETAEHHHKKAAEMISKFLEMEGNSEKTFVSALVEWADDTAVRKAVNEFIKEESVGLNASVGEFEDWLDSNLESDDEARMSGSPEPVVITSDDLRQADNGASVRLSARDFDTTQTGDITMDDDIEAELSKLDEPAAVEQAHYEELQAKAEKYESMEEDIASLRERTEVLDEVDRETVEELAEMDDPVVLESAEHEQLSAEAEEVKEVYASKVAEDTPFDAEELAERYDIGELREKFEEMGHSTEELASTETDPDPKSTDTETPDSTDEAELSDEADEQEIEQAQEELRARLGLTGGD